MRLLTAWRSPILCSAPGLEGHGEESLISDTGDLEGPAWHLAICLFVTCVVWVLGALTFPTVYSGPLLLILPQVRAVSWVDGALKIRSVALGTFGGLLYLALPSQPLHLLVCYLLWHMVDRSERPYSVQCYGASDDMVTCKCAFKRQSVFCP